MKLALKLGLFLVLGTWLALALEFWISARGEIRYHETDTRQDEHITGQVLASAFTALWRSEGEDSALALVDRANAASGRTYVRWVELDAPPGSRAEPSLPRAELESVAEGRELQKAIRKPDEPVRVFTYIPVAPDRAIAGALELSESLTEPHRQVRATLERRIRTAVALGGLSGIIALLMGAMLVGDPIRRLVDKTRRIAAGDLSQPLALRQHDEIGELAREIDAMCDTLASARARIAEETAARFTAIDQLRHADRLATVGKLASGVAHELGTPLNVASQRAKMIASGEVTGSLAADGARIIAEQTQRMTSIIRQLLAFARRHTPNTSRVDLRRIARDTATLLAPLAQRQGVDMRVEASDSPCVADVDAEQLQQALANLVINGLQAMSEGGQLTISVGVRVAQPPAGLAGLAGDHVALAVLDQGAGIAPEHLPHVFEPFFTTKDVGEGTGLGLAVSYGIVQDIGGWIEAESTLGSGSRFTILIPCASAGANGHTVRAGFGSGDA